MTSKRATFMGGLVFACIACQPLTFESHAQMTPDEAGLVSAELSASPAQTLEAAHFADLPAGRYAIFTSDRRPQNRFGVLSFEAEATCPAFVPTDTAAGWYVSASCDAPGIFEGGTDGVFAIIDVDAAHPSKSLDIVLERGAFLTLRPLDGQTFTQVELSVTSSETRGCATGNDPPTIEVVRISE